jgi:hypothetical protein
MLTCQDTYLFIGIGLMLVTAGALYIFATTIDLSTNPSEKSRRQKNGTTMAGNAMLLVAGLILVWKGKCIKKIF